MLLRLISLVLFFLCLINYSLWRDERTARKLLEEEIINTQPDARASLRPESLEQTPDAEASSRTGNSAPEHTAAEPVALATPEKNERAAGITPLSDVALYGIESRVAAIGKFISLTDEQRARLHEKYTREAEARKTGQNPESESLETIVGDQNAEFYKQQVSAAFQKSQDQELDREIFYLSRKLSFTAEQETRLRQLMQQAEEEAKTRFSSSRGSPEYAQDAGYRVRVMMQENQFKSSWLAEQLKSTLTSDQFQAYLQEEADSSGAELGIWHAP